MTTSENPQSEKSTLQAWELTLNKTIPFLVLISMAAVVVVSVKLLQPSREKEIAPVLLSLEQTHSTAKIFPSDQLFEYASAKISTIGFKYLEDLGAALVKENPESIIIVGHTDSLGNSTINSKLSQARADAVRNELLKSNINRKTMLAIGVGDSLPIIKTTDCAVKAEGEMINCLARNRRVEIWTKPNPVAK